MMPKSFPEHHRCLDGEQACGPFRPSWCPDGDLASVEIIRGPIEDDHLGQIPAPVGEGHFFYPNEVWL